MNSSSKFVWFDRTDAIAVIAVVAYAIVATVIIVW